MNINKIQSQNFGAMILDNAEYKQIKEYLVFEKGISPRELREFDEYIKELPEAEVEIDNFMQDNSMNYITGSVYTKNKKPVDFECVHPDDIGLLNALGETISVAIPCKHIDCKG